MVERPADELDVLVVGAGPVGLTAACELARHGARCRLVDDGDGPTPPHESRALAIWERTLEVFATVGVVDRVIARGLRLRAINVSEGDEPLARIELTLPNTATAYPFTISLPQGETERALIERLGEHGLGVGWRTRLTGLDQDGSGVTATLAGPDGRSELVRARWLVGCDGAHSAVRHALGLDFQGAEYEEPFLLADVRVAWDRPVDEAQVLLMSGGVVAAFPLPGERWRLIAATDGPTPDEPAGIVARFQELLGAAGAGPVEVSDPAWAAPFRIHRRIVDRLRVGRVFVAGDAAHIHSPMGGQGMNTGIQDAHNLAWKLALAACGRAADALLDSYHAERHPVAEQVLRATDRATKLVLTPHGTLPAWLRHHLIGLVGASGLIQDRAVRTLSELEIGYRDSPAVGEDRVGPLGSLLPGHDGPGPRAALAFAAGPHPGDRAPDVPPDADPRHALLLFPGDGSATAELEEIYHLVTGSYGDLIRSWLVRSAPGPDWPGAVLDDAGGSVQARYGAAGPCLYLVRPDGHVGYRAQPPRAEGLRAHLDRLYPA